MKVAYASWKGGTGKTLLSFYTMERAAASGLTVLGCDFDPQRMLVRQCSLRETLQGAAHELDVVEGDLSVPGIDALAAIADEEYDLIVCDMPGADTFTMDRALGIMDAVIIPISGSPYDLINTRNLVARAEAKGWPVYLVPNNIAPYRNRIAKTKKAVKELGPTVAPISLVRRVTHWDAAEEGLSAPEYAGSSPAAAEVREYWAWLQGALGIGQKPRQRNRTEREELAHVG